MDEEVLRIDMAREIELYKVDTWNRATIADGAKLQTWTVGPLTTNDEILAKNVDEYTRELQDYYNSDDCQTVTKDIPEGIEKWNYATDLISDCSSKMDELAKGIERYDEFAENVTENAGVWDGMTESAKSGCAASAWLTENSLLSDDSFVSAFHVLRCGSSKDDQYKFFEGDIGKDTMALFYNSAWNVDEATGNPTYQKRTNTVGNGDLSIVSLDNKSIVGDNDLTVTHKNADTIADGSILFGQYGVWQHDTTEAEVLPVIRPDAYSHFVTTNVIAFATNGADDMECSIVNSPAASVNIHGSFVRGGACQNIYDSIGVSYHYESSTTLDNIAVNTCSELYGLENSIANMKGRDKGISNSIALKGLVRGLKGEGTQISEYTLHAGYSLGISNSYALEDNCFCCLPYKNIENSFVIHSGINPVKSGEIKYGSATNSFVESKNGYYGAGGFSPVDSFVLMDRWSYEYPAANTSKSYYIERDGNSLYTSAENSFLDLHELKSTYAKYSDSFARIHNVKLVSNFYMDRTVVNTCSSTQFGYINYVRDNLINRLCNTVFDYNAEVNGNLILDTSGTNIQKAHGSKKTYNNILSLDTKSNTMADYRDSIVFAKYKETTTKYDETGPCRYNAISFEDDITGDCSIPGGEYESIGGSLIINSATSATRRIYSKSDTTTFMLTSNSNIKSYGNTMYVGNNIVSTDSSENSNLSNIILGNNISIGGSKNAHSNTFLFGSNIDADTANTQMDSVIIGSNFSKTNSVYVALMSKLSTSTTVDPVNMFLLCNESGPFFVVTKVGYSTENKHNGIYFYRNSKWYDVTTSTEVA